MNIRKISLFGLIIALFSLVSSTVYAQGTAATTTQATTTPTVTIESILEELYGTSTPGFPEYLKTLTLPTEADLPELPDQYKEVPIIVKMIPEIPGPNQTVSVSLESYSADLNRSPITWILDGRVMKQGTGEKTFTFKTGKIGSNTALTIIVKANGIDNIKKITIGPATVDLIWQANTYVPPFYKGKALFSHQSSIRVVAIPNLLRPNGTKIPASNLVYKWKKDNEVVDGVSGYGKNSVVLNDPLPVDPTLISVEVSSLDGTVTALGKVAVQSILPQAVLYEDNPLTGISYESALPGSYSLSQSEIKLVAEPYYSLTKSRDKNVQYAWSLNNTPVSTPRQGSAMIFRGEEGVKGSSKVSVEIKGSKMFQVSSTGITINFGGATSRNLFSF